MIVINILGWITLIAIVGLAVGHAMGVVKFGVESDEDD